MTSTPNPKEATMADRIITPSPATELDDVAFERAYRAAEAADEAVPGGRALRAQALATRHARHEGAAWVDTCAVCIVDDEDAFLAEQVAR